MLLYFCLLFQANANFSHCAPWKLAKEPGSKDRLDTVLWYAMESTRLAALLLQPIMPTKTAEILDQLGVRSEERTWSQCQLGQGWQAEPESRFVKAGSSPMFPPLK